MKKSFFLLLIVSMAFTSITFGKDSTKSKKIRLPVPTSIVKEETSKNILSSNQLTKDETNTFDWNLYVAALALFVSFFNLWYNFFAKGKPIFSCHKWTAIRMEKNGHPEAAFALQINVYNKGTKVLQLYDFVLVAETDDNQKATYEPIVLWDLIQWIEDGSRPDKVGRTQKGQVPLPTIVTPGQLYNFNYPILFLPIDKNTLINPQTANTVDLKLYARTDRSKKYILIGQQNFKKEEIKSIMTNSFSSVISSSSINARNELLDN